SGATDPLTLVRAAGLLQATRDDAAGREWLVARLKPDDVRPAVRAMYESGEDELLWTIFPDATSEWIWLLRAATLRRSAVDHAAAHHSHYAAATGSDEYLLGRYVAGLADEKTVASIKDRTQVAWALGVRAEAERRLDDAIAWYDVAVAGGPLAQPERRFAKQRLVALSEPITRDAAP
ncbi:MAG: hypothetical protein LC689_09805, partial [Myxococcales bacterium]|nr:hypothetical protein [Myxococcales bacterium]